MAAVNGKRPRRINNDGKSVTELGLANVDLLPGTFVKLDSAGKFIKALTASVAPHYIVNVDDLTGQGILDPVLAGESATGDYVEEGRQFAALVAASTVCIKDTALKLSATTGILEAATLPADAALVFAYSQEAYTVPASPAGGSHVRVRIA